MKLILLLLGLMGLGIIPSIMTSEATLWDLLISASIKNDPVFVGENPIVMGQVVDHAGKPVSNVELKIRLDIQSIITKTDASGFYSHEFVGVDLLPGTHIVNIMGTSQNEKIGLAGIQFQVKGPLEVYSQTAKQLHTPEAMKYLNAKASDFENDSIGLRLYNHYQGIEKKFIAQELIQKKITEQNHILEQHRKVSEELSQKIIDEKNPGAGTYSGWKKDTFVDNLDLSVKDIIKNQLNFTLNIFNDAQKAMNEVLENGGTAQEARQAYLAKATIPRDLMNNLTVKPLKVETTNSTQNEVLIVPLELVTNSTMPETQKTNVNIIVNGTTIQVGMSQTTIYLNINGTLVEFLINGTQIIPVVNSSGK